MFSFHSHAMQCNVLSGNICNKRKRSLRRIWLVVHMYSRSTSKVTYSEKSPFPRVHNKNCIYKKTQSIVRRIVASLLICIRTWNINSCMQRKYDPWSIICVLLSIVLWLWFLLKCVHKNLLLAAAWGYW